MSKNPRTASDIASWLEQLYAAKLVRPDIRTGLQVERLLRLRVHWDPEELGHCLTSLLACDRKTWEAIDEHYRSYFGLRRKVGGEPENSGERTARDQVPVIPGVMVEGPSSKPNARVSWFALGFGVIAFILASLVWFVGADGMDSSTGSVGESTTILEATGENRTGSGSGDSTRDAGESETGTPEADWHIEQVEPAVHTTVETRRTEVPVELSLSDVPAWIWLLWLPALFLGYLAVRWWYASTAVKQAFAEMDERAKQAREGLEELIEHGMVVGLAYRVETQPPLPIHALEDAATELGRAGRVCASRVLDVPPTIDKTIAAGGQLAPVFETSTRRVVPVVLVDLEDNGHPYLYGVEEILAYWRRGGVEVERYEYIHRPTRIRRDPAEPWLRLEELADRTSERPLLLFSRMRLPAEYGRLEWPNVLARWSQRVWIDLDPRPLAERRDHERSAIRKLAASGLPRFELTSEGIVAACRTLAYPGQVFPVPASKSLVRYEQRPEMQRALELWAACGSCVPDATWAQLEALRRACPELYEQLPRPQYVQRLVEWMQTKPSAWRAASEAGVDEGPKFLPTRIARLELMKKLRAYDARWANKSPERLEHRARTLLIGQLEGAASQFDDAFTRALRDYKVALHRAVLGPDLAEELLTKFGQSAVAGLVRDAVDEEMAVQDECGQVHWGFSVRAWSEGGSEGVRWRDYWRVLDGWRDFLARGVMFGSCIIISWSVWLTWEYGWVGDVPVQVSEALSDVVTPGYFRVTQDGEPQDPHPLGEKNTERYGHLRPALVATPAGSFWMGSPKDEVERDSDETRHRAEVRALNVCQTEVTVLQWKAVMGSVPGECTSSQFECGDNQPINYVSWNDACEYMIHLTEKENGLRKANGEPELSQCYTRKGEDYVWVDKLCTGYRLPTEAEWEYVARGGTTTAYSFGNDTNKLCEYANGENCETRLLEVGQLKPNPWGLFDVHGNVDEWVWDGYGSYPTQSPSTYAGAENVSVRVLRGGSFYNVPGRLRSADRIKNRPSGTFPSTGFRCVRLAVERRLNKADTVEQPVEQVDPVAAKPPETQPVPADPKTLRQREVRSRLKEYRNAVIKACHFKDMTATLQGMVPSAWTVSVRVTVSPSGTVAKVRVSGAKKAALKTCIEEQLRRRAFPSGSGQSSAKLRFTFSPK